MTDLSVFIYFQFSCIKLSQFETLLYEFYQGKTHYLVTNVVNFCDSVQRKKSSNRIYYQRQICIHTLFTWNVFIHLKINFHIFYVHFIHYEVKHINFLLYLQVHDTDFLRSEIPPPISSLLLALPLMSITKIQKTLHKKLLRRKQYSKTKMV